MTYKLKHQWHPRTCDTGRGSEARSCPALALFPNRGKGALEPPFSKAGERYVSVTAVDPTIPFLEICQKEMTGWVCIEAHTEVVLTALLLMTYH